MSDLEKIEALKSLLGKSYNEMAADLHLKSAQVFYDIKAGKSSITPRLSKKIQDTYHIDPSSIVSGKQNVVNNGRDQNVSHVNDQLTDAIIKFQELLAKKDEQLDRLIAILEKKATGVEPK